jgi:hypothetical protein
MGHFVGKSLAGGEPTSPDSATSLKDPPASAPELKRTQEYALQGPGGLGIPAALVTLYCT